MEVSLVIPCFNEEGNIENLVKKCEKFLSNKNNELVLVNNGSSDNTEKKIDDPKKILDVLLLFQIEMENILILS